MNGLLDRLVLLNGGRAAFVELKSPGKIMRPLQVKRKEQLEALGFPVFCIDRFEQIRSVLDAISSWQPDGQTHAAGAVIPDFRKGKRPCASAITPPDAPSP